MTATKSQADGRASPLEEVPGSRRARRRPSQPKLDAARREESPPPTKPSIVPPSPLPDGASPRTVAYAHSPLGQFEGAAPTLSYSIVVVPLGVALGLGGLVANALDNHGGLTWWKALSWVLAAGTLIFSSSMALVITRSFARRLEALASAAARLLPDDPDLDAEEIGLRKGDAVSALARTLGKLSHRVERLTAELEQASEQEQGRIDQLVRERTRELMRENEDLRRALGDTRGLLSVDADGRIMGPSSPLVRRWFGAPPPSAPFWEYFDRALDGAGARFESVWGEAVREPAFERLPKSIALGDRYLAIEYRPIQSAAGELERVLLLLTDITIPDPDPMTPS